MSIAVYSPRGNKILLEEAEMLTSLCLSLRVRSLVCGPLVQPLLSWPCQQSAEVTARTSKGHEAGRRSSLLGLTHIHTCMHMYVHFCGVEVVHLAEHRWGGAENKLKPCCWARLDSGSSSQANAQTKADVLSDSLIRSPASPNLLCSFQCVPY